ncbi:hypothetical protein DEU56DRAFT_61287 [Suillus clintonianus]|uniref:uncharacterized protein n=1 Tax=Suillus clintonianus TaxID=1904413 RepID=UPI001B87CD15|nr:uncharacterized protein DEU56DRAFT_61287 [Suillus clintonianus]KAG2149356.1 hypothetical protein DEU56DRAFT_61287 [Suillus clintonianus]
MKDILKTSRSSRSMGMEYLTAPLVVLSSFPPPSPETPPHLPLLMKSFHYLFPPLSPNSMSLSNCRRIVLIVYNPDRGTVDLHHCKTIRRLKARPTRTRRRPQKNISQLLQWVLGPWKREGCCGLLA